MKKLLYLVLLALPFAFVACDNDDVDGPSETGLSVAFPQGDNDYDKEFVSFKEKYGTMVLYKFDEAQFRWALTEYIPYYSNQADEAYVQKAWNLAKADLELWPEDFLKQCLPYQIFLCDSVWRMVNGSWNSETQKYNKEKSVRNTCYGYNHMAFGFANSSIDQLTTAQKQELVGDVAYALIGYATSKSKLAIPESFHALFTKWKSYYATYYGSSWGYNAAGALDNSAEIDNYTEYHDFATYVKYIVSMTPEDFEATFLSSYFDTGGTEYDAYWNVIPEHRVKQKYEAVLEYFNSLGIDLSEMGRQTAAMQ